MRTRLFITSISLFLSATLSAQTITTIAGGGSNDGRPATQIALAGPYSVAFDGAANAYVSELLLNRIRRVDAATGTITTVAGNGARGFSGDGGLATAASLNQPTRIACDGSGNLYIVDAGNERIRKVSAATQIITTVAGGGLPGSAAEGIPATSASLQPADVAVDVSGNLLIADGSESPRVRRVDASTHLMTTVAGTVRGFAGDGGPARDARLGSVSAVEVDGAGNVYIVDAANQRVRRVDSVTKIITTVAGSGAAGFAGDGGPAIAASLNYPDDVVVDRSGNLYIADSENLRIRRVDAGTKIITTIAGNGTPGFSGDGGPAIVAQLSYATRLGVDGADSVHVVDSGNGRIRKIDSFTNVITTVTGGSGDAIPATASVLFRPRSVALDSAGNLYVADQFHHRIRKVDLTKRVITTVAGTGVGGFAGDGGPATSARLYSPFGVVLDAAGNLYIADDDNYRIRKVDAATGIITTVAGNGNDDFTGDGGPATVAAIGEVSGVAVDGARNIYIVDGYSGRIRKVDAATGTITTFAGGATSPSSIGDGGPATDAQLSYPSGVTADTAGNVYIAESSRIRKVDAITRIISTVAGGGNALGDGGLATAASLASPGSVAVDGNGNLYIADTDHHRIRKVTAATKIISTIAGTGTPGLLGDDGAASFALLDTPYGVAVDRSGNVFIADTGNDRVRMIAAMIVRRRTVRPH